MTGMDDEVRGICAEVERLEVEGIMLAMLKT